MLSLLLAATVFVGHPLTAPSDSNPFAGSAVHPLPATQADTVRRRRTVKLSDWYYRRLEVHRVLSYAELPIFAGEYFLGDKLMARGQPIASWVKPAHVGVAATLGSLFAINTFTGGWNLIEAWSQFGDQRPLVVTHTALMLAADGGFALSPLLVGHHGDVAAERNHRAVAVASMGLATVSTIMMWIAKR